MGSNVLRYVASLNTHTHTSLSTFSARLTHVCVRVISVCLPNFHICSKTSALTVHPKDKIYCLSDCGVIGTDFTVKNCLELLVLSHLKSVTDSLLDPLEGKLLIWWCNNLVRHNCCLIIWAGAILIIIYIFFKFKKYFDTPIYHAVTPLFPFYVLQSGS